MTDYTKSTNFASKDSLPAGDSLKIVRGSEIDTEFTNIATAISTKADLASPTFTGTPLAPTASAGTNTTQLATTAFITTAIAAALQVIYPIGCIYTTTVSTNPNTVFGFGTWSAYGAGRVLISAGGGYSAGATGGSADATLPAHTHSVTATGTSGGQSNTHNHSISITDPGHSHSVTAYSSQADAYNLISKYSSVSNGVSVGTTSATTGISATAGNASQDHTHSLSVSGTSGSAGSSATGANLPPYIVVYMWQRTA
jgi:hypothetical protein